jgi:PIN domain nuclease of toxin-antitoxin system
MMVYSVDTSALLDAWARWYPPDLFPSVWDRFSDVIAKAKVVATDEVLNELERKADDCHAWAKERPQMFLSMDADIQISAAEVLAEFPKLVDERTGKSMGDPFVIAVARVHSLAVVTGEKGGSPQKPKIPNVCSHFGIECIDIVEMMRQLKFQF